jgi:hypothetical protein
LLSWRDFGFDMVCCEIMVDAQPDSRSAAMARDV